MTTLVVMTALPPLIAFGTHPERSALPASSAPCLNAAPRIVGQVALRVQRDRTSQPQESQTGQVSRAGPGPRRVLRPGTALPAIR